MEFIKVIIYGIIQGITEWLPISSTGHLILLENFLPLNIYTDVLANREFINMFLVVIQFGSILAVVLLYFNELFPFFKDRSKKTFSKTMKLWLLIIIASFPVGIIGLLFDDYIDSIFYNNITIVITLIFYGILFIIIENKKIPLKIKSTDEMHFLDALKVGIFQMLALIPGTSRSGSTIIGSRIIGINKETAAKFSFFLAIPAMTVASLLKFIKAKVVLNSYSSLLLFIGTLTSFIISIIVIRMFMNFIKKQSFKVFGYYRIIIGLVILIYILLGGIL